MDRLFRLLIVLLLSLSAVPAYAKDSPITTQFVSFAADDGLEIAAFIMYPETGMNIESPAIVFHHGGFGGHGARRIGAPRSAAERFAEAGYTTITLISRHVDGYLFRDIAEARYDLAGAVAYMKQRGFDQIILAGHSMGSLWTTIYQADANDPAVKAMLHFAPTHDMFPLFERKHFYKEVSSAARTAIAAQEGGFPAGPDGGLQTPPLFVTAYGRPQTAEALMNWWGQNTTNSNSDLFPQLTVPILMLGGRLDPVVPDGRMEQLQALATKSPQVDYVWYDEGDHYFTGLWDQAVSDSLSWLAKQGLDAVQPVRTRLVDTTQVLTIDAGSPQARNYEMNYPGTLFEPVGDTTETLTLILPEWKGDIFHVKPVTLARTLAENGESALVPQLRSNNFRGSLDASFALTKDDLDAWRDVARQQGYANIKVVTLGRAAYWALNYAQAQPDAFTEIVLVEPPVSLPKYMRDGLGNDVYEALISEAQARSGEGRTLTPPLHAAFSTDEGNVERIIQYPDSLLELIGPDARTKLEYYAGFDDVPLRVVTNGNSQLAAEVKAVLPQARITIKLLQ